LEENVPVVAENKTFIIEERDDLLTTQGRGDDLLTTQGTGDDYSRTTWKQFIKKIKQRSLLKREMTC